MICPVKERSWNQGSPCHRRAVAPLAALSAWQGLQGVASASRTRSGRLRCIMLVSVLLNDRQPCVLCSLGGRCWRRGC